MAAAVVAVVVEDILKSLEEWMKLGKQWGIEHELREIHNLFSSIQGVLPEAENKYGSSFELQEWVRKVKDAVFDAEYLLEELSVGKTLWQRKRRVSHLFRAIDKFKFLRRIRDELSAVVSRMQDFIGSDLIGFIRNILAEIGETHEEAAGTVPLIGRDHEKGDLMRLLLKGFSPVVIVHGVGGIGKTALVRKVLSESEVSRHYNVIIWVNASPPFDENRMSRDIIASLTKGGATEEENVVDEQLLVRIWKLLDGRKKYLFILDDLSVQYSERRRWSRFWSFLEGGATGSKILVTTRDEEIIERLPDLLRMESGPELSSSDDNNNAQPFGMLSSICIRDCPKLVCLPLIPHLTKLTLVNVSEELFRHPFQGSISLKTLRLENIELLRHLPEEWLRDPISLEELHIRRCPKLNGLSMMIPSLVKMTLANVSEEFFRKPCHLPGLKTLRLENIELLNSASREYRASPPLTRRVAERAYQSQGTSHWELPIAGLSLTGHDASGEPGISLHLELRGARSVEG